MQAWSGPDVPALPGSGLPLTLHDSATGAPRTLRPDRPVGLYVCGITPYDATHIGHASTYVAFDLAVRLWRDAGADVTYVQNVTDVDDPLLARAAEIGEDWEELASAETEVFREDMAYLRVLPPDHYVGAVEAIPTIIDVIDRLRQRGATYELDGDTYLSAAADPGFGSISHLDQASMRAVFGENGGDPDRPGKKDPLDSLLWRRQRPGEPGWDSPWGAGRPGWHIECTAISLSLLGPEFAVQGGGSDLIFPHHEMTASAARLATEAEGFAEIYVHAGMVGVDGQKMSKSKGNLVLVRDLRTGGENPTVLRLAVLAHHYRADWDWTEADLHSARHRADRWSTALHRGAGAPAEPLRAEVRRRLADDLDAPAALAAVDEWAEATVAGATDDATAGEQVASLLDALLGVRL